MRQKLPFLLQFGSPRDGSAAFLPVFAAVLLIAARFYGTGCTWRHWRPGSVELTALTAGSTGTDCTWRHWRAGSVELTALTAGSTDTGCRHGQNSPCGTNIADDGWRKEQAGYSAANLSHCQSTGTCPTAQFSGHWRGLRLSSGGQSTAIAFLSTPGASCRVLGIIYVPAKKERTAGSSRGIWPRRAEALLLEPQA